MTAFKRFASGIAAGVLIGIGGWVYLAVSSLETGYSFSRVAAAVLFTVALLCICYKGYSLFTGKVGFLLREHTKGDAAALFLGLAGNFAGAVCVGFLYTLSQKSASYAAEFAQNKLNIGPGSVLIRAFFCGILMYLAVSIFRDKKTPVGILFGIPVFILAGFEHSIADMFYLSAGFASTFSYVSRALVFLALVLIGNAAGALFIALFDKAVAAGGIKHEKE